MGLTVRFPEHTIDHIRHFLFDGGSCRLFPTRGAPTIFFHGIRYHPVFLILGLIHHTPVVFERLAILGIEMTKSTLMFIAVHGYAPGCEAVRPGEYRDQALYENQAMVF